MGTVWKFHVGGRVEDSLELKMPAGAQPLHVAMQDGQLTIWARVDPEAKIVTQSFHVRGTGHKLDGREGRHLGTVHDGPFVWHVFEDYGGIR